MLLIDSNRLQGVDVANGGRADYWRIKYPASFVSATIQNDIGECLDILARVLLIASPTSKELVAGPSYLSACGR